MATKPTENKKSEWKLPKAEEKKILTKLASQSGAEPKEIKQLSRELNLDVIRQGAFQGAVAAGADQKKAKIASAETVRHALKQGNFRKALNEVLTLHAQIALHPELFLYLQAELILAYARLFETAASYSYEATKQALKRSWRSFKARFLQVLKVLDPLYPVMRMIDILKMIISAIKAVLDHADVGSAAAASA